MKALRNAEGKLNPSLVFGETVYWLTLTGAFIAAVGSALAFVPNTGALDPALLFESIRHGDSVSEIWSKAGGTKPSGHWYLLTIPAGDALAMVGMASAIFAPIPATIAVGWLMWRRRDQFFAVIALLVVLLSLIPIVGIGTG